jgi:hypothetical protein
MVMQVLVLAVQNSVEWRHMGVATSSASFFCSMGSSFGVAIFGAIFSTQLSRNLRADLPSAALHGGLNPGSLQANPAILSALPPALHSGIVQAFADSLHIVFLAAVPFSVGNRGRDVAATAERADARRSSGSEARQCPPNGHRDGGHLPHLLAQAPADPPALDGSGTL